MAMDLLKVKAVITVITLMVALAPCGARARTPLSKSFYDKTCPLLEEVVAFELAAALIKDPRIGASLTRLHFHDCFVQGCDGSVLLNDTKTFVGEQTAPPNDNSIRGFPVVDDIKAALEAVCENTVSCADILALVARDGVVAAGGPYWEVEFGRRDSTTANITATQDLPAPFDDVATITKKFQKKSLDQTDAVALSGAHTFGKTHCGVIFGRLTNFSGTEKPDPTINPAYVKFLLQECPDTNSSSVLVNLDVTTPRVFDNAYYSNLVNGEGIFISDQSLYSEGEPTSDLVSDYANLEDDFFTQFAKSIVLMGRITPLTGTAGEIRKHCSFVNSVSVDR